MEYFMKSDHTVSIEINTIARVRVAKCLLCEAGELNAEIYSPNQAICKTRNGESGNGTRNDPEHEKPESVQPGT